MIIFLNTEEILRKIIFTLSFHMDALQIVIFQFVPIIMLCKSKHYVLKYCRVHFVNKIKYKNHNLCIYLYFQDLVCTLLLPFFLFLFLFSMGASCTLLSIENRRRKLKRALKLSLLYFVGKFKQMLKKIILFLSRLG